ncbi:MAG: 30S ribosomal protein S18 [Candidatus Omnitrophica bacterium]|nr:30S ribosomal protein S18 [Candidatus Omnitrophota bacterium]MBU4333877.1 30S ribosomal protein S18 [Candidatus Omnitrophota bacterium]
MKKKLMKPRRNFNGRQRNTAKYQMSKDTDINYKNVSLLQKYLNDRGKVVPRRITGVTAKEQRRLIEAIKNARFLSLLITGGVKK